MKIYDTVLSIAGWLCTGCAIGAVLLHHYPDASTYACIAAIALYCAQLSRKGPPSDPKV